MLQLSDAEFIIFDVETTGLSVQDGDRIIEIGAVKLKAGKVIDTFTSFVNPCRPLNAEAMKTNKITEDMVRGAPTSAEVLPKFAAFAGGSCLAAHNASFDIKFVCYEMALHGRRLREETPVVDTIKAARQFMPHLTSFRLEYIAHSLGLPVGITHRAQDDAVLTAGLLHKLLGMAEDNGVVDLQDFIRRFGVDKPVCRPRREQETSLF